MASQPSCRWWHVVLISVLANVMSKEAANIMFGSLLGCWQEFCKMISLMLWASVRFSLHRMEIAHIKTCPFIFSSCTLACKHQWCSCSISDANYLPTLSLKPRLHVTTSTSIFLSQLCADQGSSHPLPWSLPPKHFVKLDPLQAKADPWSKYQTLTPWCFTRTSFIRKRIGIWWTRPGPVVSHGV